MEVFASARHIRMSPRKVRLVVGLVRGLNVEVAASQLRFMRKAAARPVLKLIMSAVANAEHNFKLHGTLYVKAITVDNGPVLHRWRPRAFGRAAAIKKRSSHINVILEERGITGTPKKDAAVAAAAVKVDAKAEAKPAAKEKFGAKKKATKS